MNDENQPKVRFAGFTDPWEQRKAKEVFKSFSEKEHESYPVLSVTQDQGVVYRDNLDIDIKYDPATLSNYKVVHPYDFVISLRSFQGGFELSEILGISSPAYTIFNFISRENHNCYYWKFFFKTYKFIESLKKRSHSGLGMESQLVLLNSLLLNCVFHLLTKSKNKLENFSIKSWITLSLPIKLSLIN
ncbi:hypothetical protein [Paucilactobacillus hokkaidonensis]|uniref:hypothetical protein n=1 Tax=Paucilactobacillus hokkaidonensis TaxID=1193095 RepID=UPI0006D20D1E|nr:hypothetical protein [Paucilactobacillus hokkaidonensis]